MTPPQDSTARKEAILEAAVLVFGRYGYRKTSVEDLAEAAGLSKQGLYLHFASKEAVFAAAVQKYFADGIRLADAALEKPGASLYDRLLGAMDAYFGRNLTYFTPDAYDVIEASKAAADEESLKAKTAFRIRLTKAIAEAPEFKRAKNVCAPKDIADILYQFGNTWKDGQQTRADFMKKVGLCIRACCQIAK